LKTKHDLFILWQSIENNISKRIFILCLISASLFCGFSCFVSCTFLFVLLQYKRRRRKKAAKAAKKKNCNEHVFVCLFEQGQFLNKYIFED
jgi:hypothetical protein